MLKKELIDSIAVESGLTKKASAEFLDVLVESIKTGLTEEDVIITGFGKFYTKDRAERSARNPITGAAIIVPADKKVGFKFSKVFKNNLNWGIYND